MNFKVIGKFVIKNTLFNVSYYFFQSKLIKLGNKMVKIYHANYNQKTNNPHSYDSLCYLMTY